jgi:hypothetical protein
MPVENPVKYLQNPSYQHHALSYYPESRPRNSAHSDADAKRSGEERQCVTYRSSGDMEPRHKPVPSVNATDTGGK